MNSFIESEINDTEKRMTGFRYLLTFRYMNLCVKADANSLLPVTVVADGEEKNIEDVGEVMITDDYHIAIIPTKANYLKAIQEGVADAHPEFKTKVLRMEEDEDSTFLLYEMPPVNKERRDFLDEAVKSLHDECKVRLEEIRAEELAGFAQLYVAEPEELKDDTDALDDCYNRHVDSINEMLEGKRKEIEEAYERYESTHGDDDQTEEEALTVMHSMKMSGVEE